MIDREDIESKIKDLIERFVDEHWANTQTVCYLSSMGLYLNQAAPDGRAALSKGLREFLRQNPVVHVVTFPGVEQKIGAVPLSIPLPDDVGELFSQKQSTFHFQKRNVYFQEFWDAFIRPIEGLPRYILVDEADRITVHDGHVGDEIRKAYKIQPQDLTTRISDGSIADKIKATHSAINNWLQTHTLDSAIFLRPRIEKQDYKISDRLAKLLHAFDGLSSDDLARIEIPLDVLVKLNSEK